MKKHKILAVMLCLVILSGSMTVCGKTVDVDETKTQLYVAITEGGAGQAWFTDLKNAFEAEYAEESFEEGKTGVEVFPQWGKEEYQNNQVLADLQSGSKDNQVYMITNNDYNTFVANNLWLDITDIVKNKAQESETMTIEEKLFDGYKTFYSNEYQKTTNPAYGNYYALPATETLLGINYDMDLFDERNYYFYENGFKGSGTKASGPDGIPGTLDDGLPSTYAELKQLIEEIEIDGYVPFTWTSLSGYLEEFVASVMIAEAGEEFKVNYSFAGEITREDGTKVQITEKNGYELINMKGRKYAVQVAYDFGTNGTWSSAKAFDTNQTHIKAQQEYIWGGTGNITRCAMIIEGSWWENEADSIGAFDQINIEIGDRRYGFMPFPKENGNPKGEGNTFLSSTDKSIIAINAAVAGTKYERLSKLFVQFCMRDDILSMYTASTGILRPYEYKLSKEQYAGLTTYAQTVCGLLTEPANEVIPFNIAPNRMRVEQNSYLVNLSRMKSHTKTGDYDNLISNFKNNSGLDVEYIYDGLLSVYTQSEWNSKLAGKGYWD